MRFLLAFAGKRNLLIMLLASFFILLFDLLGIVLIFPFLNYVVNPDTVLNNQYVNSVFEFFSFGSIDNFIIVIGIILIVVYVLKLVIKTILNAIRYYINSDITYRLSSRLFEGLLTSRYSLFTEKSVSEMINIVNAQTIHSVICLESVVKIANELLFFTVLLCVFLYMDPIITLWSSFLLAVVGISIYLLLIKRISLFGKIHAKLNILVYQYGFATANSMKDIKIMRLENNYTAKFRKIWKEYTVNDAKTKTYKGVPADFSEVLIYCVIVFVGLYVFVEGQDFNDLIPILGVIAVSAMRVLPSFNRIISGYNEYKFYQHSLHLVKDLLEKIDINRQNIEHLELPFDESLNISDLAFSYGDKQVIDYISIEINKGGSYAFVGSSGAGKSTLLDVLVGLREADTGRFCLDGIGFDPFKTDALRNLVGYVPQSVSLIDESIAFNISFDENYDKEKMNHVIAVARLDQFVSNQADGLETLLGESGVRVSGGQKQRIGIARALYRDPEILIFDEATSALDTVTERELMKEINQLSGNKTLIIVAHRLSTVENCTAIHLLDNGAIIASGTHEELLKSSPEYQTLYNQQGES